ncbi:glycoside hydrolase family 25 protein [Spirosoma validum]|uniref:Glycoside hydrolase n=1 Tax=Spirosoma validum TaxID=2771355 RepID=A0A927B1M1_9BACT|nr:GH25 family lysozyme [Spirosoma validum]MBD2753602.1 glycoside hydrolase [Spirosoma validum]
MKFRVLAKLLFRRYGLWFAAILILLIGFWVVRSRRPDELDWRFVQAFGIRLPMRYSIHGIDVSRHNDRINWAKVRQMEADGVRLQFVFIKATEGATLADKHFDKNWREAKKSDLRRGAYHFYHPTRDPLKQASNFIAHVHLNAGDFAPVVDFEVTNGQSDETIVDGLRLWLETVEKHYQVQPIIYTNGNLYRRYIKGNLDEYPLWIADYSTKHLRRYNADKLYLWQHSQNGWVKGIRGQVDFNVFVMNEDRMQEICL